MRVVYAPHSIEIDLDREFSVFLAGSIDQGTAIEWQAEVEKFFGQDEDVVLFNPRRPDWDNSWSQVATNPKFKEQVEWELSALEDADLVALYLAPGSLSPISLLELGIFAHTRKLIVCCPEGFWRKGNVDIVCARYGIMQCNSLIEMCEMINNFVKDDDF